MSQHQQHLTTARSRTRLYGLPDSPTNQTVLTVMALSFPVRAMAQQLNATIIWLFVGAPVVALMTTVVVAVVARSWRTLLVGIVSLVFWISWYWVAAQFARKDIYFWIPIVAIHMQAVLMGGWLCWRLLRRKGA